MKKAFFLLMVAALATANSPFFNQPAVPPGQAVLDQVTIFTQILFPLMIILILIAGAVYGIGQIFGTETRARATVWSHSLIVAVGISVLIIASIYILLPGFFGGSVSDIDIVQKMIDIRNISGSFLAALTVVLTVFAAAVYAAGMFFGAETRARAATWAGGLIAAAFLCAIIYVLLAQILPQFETTFFSGTGLALYGFVIVQIVFFVASFILVTFLISKVFKVPEWEAYLNIEMSNLISSFLLVLFVLALFGVGEVLAMAYTGASFTSPPQAAIAYIQGTVADSAMRASVDVYKINACTSMLSTFSRRIGEYVLTQTYKVFPGLDTFVSITNALGFSLLTLYNTASIQVVLLHVADALMIPFFLPAGLILRFFPPTRDAGAFLISVAFGFQIVFPMTYLINKQIYEEIGAKPYSAPGQRPTVMIQNLCGWFKYGAAGFIFNPTANPIYSLIPGGQVIGNALSKIVSEGLLNTVSMAEFIPIMEHIAELSLLALFMPALSMMVTIAFINAMAKFIVAKV